MSTASSTITEPPAQPVIAGFGAVVLVGGAALLATDGWKPGALFLVGGLLGVSLYHAAFGFTAAYRNAIVRRDVSGVIAQLVMLGAAMLLFAPVLAEGRVFGHGVVGAVARWPSSPARDACASPDRARRSVALVMLGAAMLLFAPVLAGPPSPSAA